MKTLLRRWSIEFDTENTGLAEAMCPTGSEAFATRMVDMGMARSKPTAETYLRTIVNAEFLPPLWDDLVGAMWRRYAVAQHPLGRFWLELRVHVQRMRAVWLANSSTWSKRALDVVVSLALLLALSPLFMLIGALVWLEDGGPVFFAQTRVGQDGSEFKMYKIRSMCHNAEERLRDLLAQNCHKEGVTFKLQDDPRITRVGKWLRKFSLDELPQLYNVLVGDMSLVGPRPPVPREVAKYSPADRRRLAVKPGVTCIWQVSGRSEIDFSGQVELDVDYIESQSLWVDLKILARTIPAVITGKGAC